MIDFLMFFVVMMITSAVYAFVICKIPDMVVREVFLWTGVVLIVCGFGLGIIFVAL